MIVLELGATSAADLESIDRAASITHARLPSGPVVVVVAAFAGVTELLLGATHYAARGDRATAHDALNVLRERHLVVVEELVRRDLTADCTGWEVDRTFNVLVELADALAILGHATPRTLDMIAALGAELAARLVTAALRAMKLPAQLVDAREIIVTDGHFTRATPLPAAIENAVLRVLRPLVDAGCTPVLGGSIGATAYGVSTTLGPGGSELSAALIGAALGAEVVGIPTGADGTLTLDPTVDPCA